MTYDEMIAMITAAKEGKTIQLKYKERGNDWVDVKAPVFNFEGFHYRVKKEPQVVYMVVYNNGAFVDTYGSKHFAEVRASMDPRFKVKKFIEVIDD